ncbi:MAG: hypothetical protein DRJ37_00610 [Thermoprotei archaeon]|nr:MAG: hypothetical protein DRJ37_00610 [Thermoprotei archaeon]
MRIGRIRITPIADESLGVRSMCLFVETPDVRILFDPGVSLAPRRYGLPPHPLEFKAAREARRRILNYARKADIVTVSHYHLDHYTPAFRSWYEWTDEETYVEVYSEKIILAKSIEEHINFNQRKRGFVFKNTIEDLGSARLLYFDAGRLLYGSTTVEASPPLPHGPEGSKLGWVLVFTVIHEGHKVMYAPDVQGPISKRTLSYILSIKPDILVIGGPPLYLSGRKIKKEEVEKGLANLRELSYNLKYVILSHHLLRDKNWDKLSINAFLFSSILGSDEELLEANRDILYEERPPSEDFLKWIREYKKAKDFNNPPPLD